MEYKNIIQKVIRLMNVSSETFMLIALVSLFVMPIAIAKNLEPIVISEKSKYLAPKIVNYVDLEQVSTPNEPVAQSDVSEGSVLGIFNFVGLNKMIVADENGLKTFPRVSQNLGVESYTLSLETNSKFQKTNLFSLKNTSGFENVYEFNVSVVGDPKTLSNTLKNIYINNQKYTIGVDAMPVIKLMPGEQVVVALDSPKTNPTNLVIEVRIK